MYRNDKPSPGFKWRPRLETYTDGVNNEFNPKDFIATSYRWWTYLCKIKGKVVFNNYPYSSSTQMHQRHMRDLLKKLKIKIDLEVCTERSLTEFKSRALPGLYEALFTVEIAGRTARKDGVYVDSIKQYFNTRAKAIVHIKASIKACRALGAKMPKTEIKALQLNLEKQNVERLEANREKSRELAKQRKTLKSVVDDLSPIDLGFDRMEDTDSISL